jgi:amidase
MGSVGASWQDLVAQKQGALRDKIPKAWVVPQAVKDQLVYPLEENPNRLIDKNLPRLSGLLSDKELSITEDYTITNLLESLASGNLTAVEVTTAFSKRASIAGQLLNCLTETYFDEALERAKSLDQMREHGKLAGPLHGLPISLKDSFQIKGSESTIGYVSYLGQLAEHDSALVELLRDQGAIFHVKTNIPHSLMTADSMNNIFGRTLNPHNTMLTAGGSSGGEGALVAFRGSPIGVGTDVAGSIRIPAACCGTYGFKPTTNRVPYSGQANPSDVGSDYITPSAGPLANDLAGIKLWCKAVVDAQPARYDAAAHDVPWRQPAPRQKMRFGLLEPAQAFPLHPPMQRALDDTVRLVREKGHEVVNIPDGESKLREALLVAFATFPLMSDGGARIQKSGEPPIPSLVAIQNAVGKLPLHMLPGVVELEGTAKLSALRAQRSDLREHWRKIWNKYDVDAIIAPAGPSTAPPLDQFKMPVYTVFMNLMDVSLDGSALSGCPQ